MKKTLLQVFLSVHDFDIVVLGETGETHLTSKIHENDLELEGYSFQRCDHPDDTSRGSIGVYYKTSLPCMFKPQLTNLSKTLVFQIKIRSKECLKITHNMKVGTVSSLIKSIIKSLCTALCVKSLFCFLFSLNQ